MLPIHITVRSVQDSPVIEYHIYKHFKKVQKLCRKINNCHVVIDLTKNHKHKDKLFSVSIDLKIPGKELVSRKQNKNLYAGIRDAFDALEKILQKHNTRRQKGVDYYKQYPMFDTTNFDHSTVY